MPKIDLDAIPQINRTGYPAPHDAAVAGRHHRRLGPASGLTQFAVSHVVLRPGAWSSQRHWHDDEDEFLVMIAGEAVLVEDEGETVLRPGDCASFPKGTGNGHHIQNRGSADCEFVVVGSGAGGTAGYSDIDMMVAADGSYVRKDGTPYAAADRVA